MSKEYRVWYDPEEDTLDVQWERKEGVYGSTDNKNVLVRLDDKGNPIGFKVEGLAGVESLQFNVEDHRDSGLENVTAKMAARELGISVRRVRQLCADGRIQGASRPGHDWLIPLPIEITAGESGPTGVAGKAANGVNRKMASTRPSTARKSS